MGTDPEIWCSAPINSIERLFVHEVEREIGLIISPKFDNFGDRGFPGEGYSGGSRSPEGVARKSPISAQVRGKSYRGRVSEIAGAGEE